MKASTWCSLHVRGTLRPLRLSCSHSTTALPPKRWSWKTDDCLRTKLWDVWTLMRSPCTTPTHHMGEIAGRSRNNVISIKLESVWKSQIWTPITTTSEADPKPWHQLLPDRHKDKHWEVIQTIDYTYYEPCWYTYSMNPFEIYIHIYIHILYYIKYIYIYIRQYIYFPLSDCLI